MAAKGYGYFRTRSGVARRYARPTMRPRVSRSPRYTKQNCLEEAETNYTTQQQDDSGVDELTPSPDESLGCPTPATTIEANQDGDLSGPITPPACECRPLTLDLSDFSRHMDKALERGVHSNTSSLTVCDVDSFTRVAPEGSDLYGWDAELNRKLEKGCTGSTLVCSCLVRRSHDNNSNSSQVAAQPQRSSRHASAKRNLLQRVFSGLGEARPRAE